MTVDTIPIRAARRGDVPSLLLLWGAMLEENARLDARLAVHPDAKEHMARTLAGWIEDSTRVVLVAEEGRHLVVGYVAGVVSAGNGYQGGARVGQVTDCFVVPPRRRRGVARRLVSRMHDLLFERGAESVRLTVSAKNEASQAFWASLGYEPLEEVLERPAKGGGGDASAGGSR